MRIRIRVFWPLVYLLYIKYFNVGPSRGIKRFFFFLRRKLNKQLPSNNTVFRWTFDEQYVGP